ncbi:SRPBCC family protein [Streptomyces fulvoviolaceus]|uniref:SRPBCC family protein n=1 Tax=Streptomyces fulvoviolaceus TaxID=285535 RepID=UPI0004CB2CE7|nr:SRPBCC family protein [Streptomyces fulvoviolaceus]
MGQLHMVRHVEMNLPRDQVWEHMTDIRRAMTLDQFHVSIDCTETEATNPKTGMVVPILHRILGWDHTRLARITKYGDYEIAWGESTPPGEFDTFPHSEGWKIEEIDSKTSSVTLWMKGNWRTPVGEKLQPFIWDSVIAPNLDRDMSDLAQAVGADMSRSPDPVPDIAGDLLSMAFIETINGMPAKEFFDQIPPLYPDDAKETGAN